jgi:mannitol operon transcriptional antiterminator
MSLDARSSALLNQLVDASSFLSIKEITERMNVSRRTVYYDIEKINDWLEEQGLSKIQQVRSGGLLLDEETKSEIPKRLQSLKSWHYEYSASERKSWLAIHLLTSESNLYLEHLMEKNRVSRNTTIEDLKVLKEELQNNDLSLKFDKKTGYYIAGDESDKRKAIVYYLSIAIPEKSWHSLLTEIQMILNSNNGSEQNSHLFNIEELKAVHKVISNSEKELNVQFTDDVIQNLCLRILLFAKRLSQGKRIEIDTVEKEVLSETKEYEAAVKITEELEKIFEVKFPEDESYYITTHLLSAKVQYSNRELSDNRITHELKMIITKMVNDFQRFACILFQERNSLEKNLFVHLKPTYYRVKYGLIVENQLGDLIKTKYPEVFEITKKVIHHFEGFVGKSLHFNEIAFIAVHFGGWMKREGIVPATRKKALIVCANGVGTSQILRHQIEGLFSTVDIVGTVSLRDYESKDYDVDFVISTTSVKKKEHETFVVSPILNEAEKESLLKKVNSLSHTIGRRNSSIDGLLSIIKNHADIHDENALYKELKEYLNYPTVTFLKKDKPSLGELIPENMIQLKDHIKDWKEAIKVASFPLLEHGVITDNYINSMIENVVKMGPYIVIAPGVAIPHAKQEDGVLKLGMSLLRLKNPVSFSPKEEHNVNIILTLAPIDSETHLKALSQLSDIMSSTANIQRIIQSKTKKEVRQVIVPST